MKWSVPSKTVHHDHQMAKVETAQSYLWSFPILLEKGWTSNAELTNSSCSFSPILHNNLGLSQKDALKL